MNYPYSVPAMGAQNVFIYGHVNSATSTAATEARVNGVYYLATNTNVPSNLIVQPSYSGSNFTISASENYGMPSSVNFGMNIQVTGITGSINVAAGTGSLSVASASLKSVSYSTDQAGDSQAALSFSGANCALSNQGVNVVFASGTPCTGGTGTGRQATVEVWGNYSCPSLNSASGAAINISGSFDGLTTLVDSCSGGGGGGGGIVPINL